MAKPPIVNSLDHALSLGFKLSTKPLAEIHKMIDDQIAANPASRAFRKDCLTLPDDQRQKVQCLQSDCGPDGREYVGFCDGITCETYSRPCTM